MEDPWQHWLQTRSEEAFRAVVQRHLPLVLATAQRRTNGDAALAQDVAQLVFIDLARIASALPRGVVLAGWLYRHTCFTAAKAVRSERRRSVRERLAADVIASPPQEDGESKLDDILESLPAKDRHALLLRFAEGMDLDGVGTALGISRAAAQKRIERAVARLKETLPKALRPRTASAAGLAALLVPASSRTAAAAMAPAVQEMAVVAANTAKGSPLLTFFKNLGAMQGAAMGVALAVMVWAVPVSMQVREMRAGASDALPQSAAGRSVTPRPGSERLTGDEAGNQMAAIFLSRGFTPDSAAAALRLLKRTGADARLDAVTAMLAALPPGSRHSGSVVEVLKGFGRDGAWRPRRYPEDILTAMNLMPANTEPSFEEIVENHPDVDGTLRLYRELRRRNEISPRDRRPTYAMAAARALAGRSLQEALDFSRGMEPDEFGAALTGIAKAASLPDQRREMWQALAGDGDRRFQHEGAAALIKAAPAAESGQFIDRQPPGSFRNDAATLLARRQLTDDISTPVMDADAIADAWLARVPPEGRRAQLPELWRNTEGSTQRWHDFLHRLSTQLSGPDLDALLVHGVTFLAGISSNPQEAMVTWERIQDPDVRFFAACELISKWSWAGGTSESWLLHKTDTQKWMDQHLTAEEQEVFTLLHGKQ